jgi:hypothetical protein
LAEKTVAKNVPDPFFRSESILVSEDNYYAAVEKHFLQCRGGSLFTTTKDWQLIHDWHERQIPLRVVKAGVDRALGGRKSHRPDCSLSYCRQSVEAEYRRHLEITAGAATGDPSQDTETRDYLVRLGDKLREAAENSKAARPRLAELIGKCGQRITELVEELGSVEGDRELEGELERLEGDLMAAAESSLDEQDHRRCLEEAERFLSDYKDRMPAEVYASAVTSAYRKRVRALLGLPALSLFYL